MTEATLCASLMLALVFSSCASSVRPTQDPSVANDESPDQSEVRKPQPPVIVTARRRAESIQDVPQTITAIAPSRIGDGGATNIKEAARYVPNMLVPEFSSRRLSFPYVRGIGSGQGDPAVATFIDGVPQLTTSSTNIPLVDVERIEFLRGPEGVLYGRNTIGGAIHILTRTPSDATRIGGGLSYGRFNQVRGDVTFETPLVANELFLSASVQHAERDGYTKNDFTGNDVDSRDSWFGRGQLYWTPDDVNEFKFAIYGQRARDGGFVLSDLGGLKSRPHRINQDFEGDVDRDIVAPSLTWKHSADDFELTSITGVQDWSIHESADFDFMAIDGIRRFTDEDQTYGYQEFRAASPDDQPIDLGEGRTLRWLAGISGFVSSSKRSAANVFRPAGAGILFPPSRVGTDRASGSFDDHAFALFGQVTIGLAEGLEVTGALRYDYESKEADARRTFKSGAFTVPTGAFKQRERFDEFMPRASIAYRYSESVLGYGLVARGFKAGGFNLTAPSAGLNAFRPETSWTYELGVKTDWWDKRVRANASVFFVRWEDMQLSQFDRNSGGYIANAGRSESRGVEVELSATPYKGLDVFAGFGALDTEFKRFVDSFGQDVRGKDLPFAPKTTLSLGAEYSREVSDTISVFARAEYFHVGKFYYDAGNLGSERYELANFRLGIGGHRWRVFGWIRNAFDERYSPVAFQPNPANPSQFVGENAAPETYGFSVRLTF